MLRSTYMLALSAAALVAGAVACTSSDTSAGSDSGGDVTSETVSSSGGSSSSGGTGSSSGGSQKCDGSVAIPAAGTDGAAPPACIQCMTSSCADKIAACGGDCACAASLTCLFMNNLNYTLCPTTALAQIMSGNPPLQDWNACTAMKCDCPCFHQGCADSGASSD
jgi:hypothetical protein